jgi:indolepyruvate ferredoxin oxidoreductase beta subunit
MASTGILIVGVGGQGTLLSSRIMGKVALAAGYDVRVSEVHGMSQRGGSVVTYVRFGDKIYSPLVEKGQADFILAFEKLEALRWVEYLKPDGKVIANVQEIMPMPVMLGLQQYPAELDQSLSEAVATFFIDAKEIAIKCGSVKAVNIVLLGFLASQLKFDYKLWSEVIENNVPPKTKEINLRAFNEGFEAGINVKNK